MNHEKLIKDRSFWLQVSFIVSIIFLITFLFWLVIVSLYNGTHMDSFGANGTFQLYNPLRRLSAGQTIGLGFPFFHGIGLPLLHFPFFKILGSNVFAAETVKWLISPLLFLSSSFIFFYAFFGKFKESIISLALLTIAALSWIDVIWPGNSLLGARGTFPVLIAAALIWKTHRLIKIKHYSIPANEVAALVLLGLSLLFGTEQGIAAIIAYALLNFVIIIRNRSENFLQNTVILALKGLFIIVIAFLSYIILTKGHPLTAIKYAFIDVPTDQGWYFGTDPQCFLKWNNLLPELFTYKMRFMWATIVIGAASIYIFIKKLKQDNLKKPLFYMLGYGLIVFIISTTGYYAPSSQLIPLQRMMALIFISLAVLLIFSERTWRYKNIRTPKHRNLLIGLIFSMTITILAPLTVTYLKISAITTNYDVISVLKQAKLARHSDDYFASSIGWKESIDTFRPHINPDLTIWSLYGSVYDTTFGNQLNPSAGGEDYIIHALGNERRASYEKEFIATKPHYVITLKPSYFTFEEWLWINHWNIYKQIFTNYTLISENASHYLWEINPSYATDATTPTAVTISDNIITLPDNNTRNTIVYTVNIKYKTHTNIPFTNKFPRYTVSVVSKYKAQDYKISLPSQKQEWSFPVISMPGNAKITLKASVEGITPFADLTIQSATYVKTKISQNSMKPIENNACFIHHEYGVPKNYPWTCDSVNQNLKLKESLN